MPEFKKDDAVEASRRIEVPGQVITPGTGGRVTANTSRRVATVRVKFQGAPGVRFRVVPKTSTRRR